MPDCRTGARGGMGLRRRLRSIRSAWSTLLRHRDRCAMPAEKNLNLKGAKFLVTASAHHQKKREIEAVVRRGAGLRDSERE